MSFAVRASFVVLILLLPTLLAACGPVRSTIVLIQADTALREARALGSAEVAPYPTEMSYRLIEKAKEEQGYSSYDTATVLAEDARMLARDALRLAKEAAPAAEENAVEPEAEVESGEVAEDPATEEQTEASGDEAAVEGGEVVEEQPAAEGGEPPAEQPVESDEEVVP